MKTRQDISVLIKKNFLKAIDNLSKKQDRASLSGIYIMVDKETGEVAFNDDAENKIGDIVIFDWIDKQDNLKDDFIISILRDITLALVSENAFAPIEKYKPFTVNYSDDSSIIEEILTIMGDDEVLDIQDEEDLMEKFDREFDDFLEKLLKE